MSRLPKLIELAAAGDFSPVAVIAVDAFIFECGPVTRVDIESTLGMSRPHVGKVLTALKGEGLLIKTRAGSRAPAVFTHALAGEPTVLAPVVVPIRTEPVVEEQTDNTEEFIASVPALVLEVYNGFVGTRDDNGKAIDDVAAAHFTRSLLIDGLDDTSYVMLLEKTIIETLAARFFGSEYSGSWAKYTRQWLSFGERPFDACCVAISKVASGAGPNNPQAYPGYLATATKTASAQMGVAV